MESAIKQPCADIQLKQETAVVVAADNVKLAPLPSRRQGVEGGEEGERTIDDDVTAAQQEYTVFTKGQKTLILFLATWAGLLSPLTANIYFPALTTLATDLGVSQTRINLTVTSYMIFQGLSPTIFGGLGDTAGRRPAYILAFTIYLGANIGLALQDSYAALLVLRCLQSAGCSGAIALGNGVVADISVSSERGIYMGVFQSGAMIGPSLGPLIGGLVIGLSGWRTLFWFLVVFGGVFMITFLAFFPETSRNVVGNGSLAPTGWHKPLISHSFNAPRTTAATAGSLKPSFRWPNPLHTFAMLGEKETGVILAYNAIIYTAFYDVAASTPTLFTRIYGYSALQVGLCYLPYGVGCAIGCIAGGRVMDWNFLRIGRKPETAWDGSKGADLGRFPIERARIQVIWPILYIGIAAICCYGWTLEWNASVAAPLVLQFIIGLCVTGSFNVLGTLLVDLHPTDPSAATAANNLVRCLLGAAGTGIIDIMISGMGSGWCFTCIALICLVTSPMLWLVTRWGPGWRDEGRRKKSG
ncbi:hypothetical protein A1O1_08642 [Capronia coronata CBS 617.96]|uniref:Citrate exporter 1 n=1 Tax=Capronia coronata CBS 617.96 TaxID=1182541 RepID=W9XJ09_9EURO|nr:uncharacterized protein A1O1_08642 [Capronia coronata CBS 617.96]EXJ80497.1 hypothetical protein A1O1_08642 [Capronia coronata CBS 617.96]